MSSGRLFACLAVLAAGFATAPLRAADAPSPLIKLAPLTGGLERPLHVTHDGTQRLFIVEQPGRVRLFKDGKLNPVPYLDISKQVHDGGECGLLSVTFHPDFAKNGYLYVNYTARRPNLKTVIAEFHADPKADTVDPATERTILTIDQPYANHNGGQCAFGPDGYFYIGMGDGGSAGDPQNNAQNPGALLGKILRIDVNKRDPYVVPKDNPFVDKPAFKPEIWAWGLRNPWRFSFDRTTGELYTGDVGQDLWEEIDIIAKGGNYGWRIREGLHEFRPAEANVPLIDPIKEYPHKQSDLSVTGGFVYRGKAIPKLVGWYVYADYVSGRIWGLRCVEGKVMQEAVLRERPEGRNITPSSFGEDVDGELYVCDHAGGAVYKIVGQ